MKKRFVFTILSAITLGLATCGCSSSSSAAMDEASKTHAIKEMTINPSDTILYLYDGAIDDYPAFVEYIQGNRKAKDQTNYLFWPQKLPNSYVTAYDSASFFIQDFNNDGKGDLGIISGNSDDYTLRVVFENGGELITCTEGIELQGESTCSAYAFLNSIHLEAISKSEDEDNTRYSMYHFESNGMAALDLLYLEIYDYSSSIYSVSLAVPGNDMSLTAGGSILEDGTIEFASDEDKATAETAKSDMETQKALNKPEDGTNLLSLLPTIENGAVSTKYGDILK